MPTIGAGGLSIGYDATGTGPPLILLHAGSSSGRRDFGAQLPTLAGIFRCLLPDARGHGRTRWDPADGLEAARLVDDVVAFADALELETFHLLGFSMGAMTALGAAIRVPERVRSLVVVGITIERAPRASVVRHALDPNRIAAEEPRWASDLAARHDPADDPGRWRRLVATIASDVAVQPLLSPAEVRSIETPTLVVVGDRDPFTPVDHAARLARSVRNGRLLVVPDAAHQCLAGQPAITTAALQAFYTSLPGHPGQPVAKPSMEVSA